jgi:hypothetical protein
MMARVQNSETTAAKSTAKKTPSKDRAGNTSRADAAKKNRTRTSAKPAEKKRTKRAEFTEISVTMTRFKETKGAWQYREVDDNEKVIDDFKESHIGSIYLRKSDVGDDAPESITVTVAVE